MKTEVGSTIPPFYTPVTMNPEEQRPKRTGATTRKRWNPTKVQHLVRHESGTYYVRLKKDGKQTWRSLKTANLEIARRRLVEVLAEHKQRTSPAKIRDGAATRFGEISAIMLQNVDLDPSRKPRTKRYWAEVLDAMWRTWPSLKETEIKRITARDCLAWASRHSSSFAATRYNGALTALKHVFKTAIQMGLRSDNPASGLKRLRPKTKDLASRLPSVEKFKAWVANMRASGRRYSVESADVVEFIAYSGLRITEARNVCWHDWDRDRNQLIVRGDPEDGTKNREIRRIDLIPAMKAHMERLSAARTNESQTSFVLAVKDARYSMKLAAEALKISDLTHHDLRHLFATMCIEAGVDIPTVSKWLGHKDGGALAMRVYGHLRHEHSLAAAARVSFGT